MKVKKVLVVGQTPPPFGGQAVMIEKMLAMRFPDIELIHIRMDFSREMAEIGRFQYRKVLRLFSLIAKIILARFSHGTTLLCYPPAGPPNRVPLYRDLIILFCTRWMFRHSVWYFHACGLADWIQTFPPLLRKLAWSAYRRPSATIQLSEYTPNDGLDLQAKRVHHIPYGIEDALMTIPPQPGRTTNAPVRILFVGWMCELKGVLVLLEAGHLLQERGLAFRLDFMGSWDSPEFKCECEEAVALYGLEDKVRFLGVQTGDQKFRTYSESDIFTLPTHHDSESFGLVAVEAMCVGLPVVATRWRGLQSIVEDTVTGFLVPRRDPPALADKFETLILDPDLRKRMGERGRRLFLEKYTIPKYHEKVAQVFRDVEAG